MKEILKQYKATIQKYKDRYKPKSAQEDLGKSKDKDILPGGLADDKTNKDFPAKKIKQGEKVELEHTSNRTIAQEIVRDHLSEDPNYYTKLAEMEKGDELEKASYNSATGKWEPEHHDPEGLPHKDNPQHVKSTSVKFGKKPVWKYRKDIADLQDKSAIDNLPQAKQRLPEKAKLIDALHNRVLSDQDRHVVDRGQKDPELRVRHLGNAFKGAPGYAIQADPRGIVISAERHSKGKPSVKHSWHFDGKALKFISEEPISNKTGGGYAFIKKSDQQSGGQLLQQEDSSQNPKMGKSYNGTEASVASRGSEPSSRLPKDHRRDGQSSISQSNYGCEDAIPSQQEGKGLVGPTSRSVPVGQLSNLSGGIKNEKPDQIISQSSRQGTELSGPNPGPEDGVGQPRITPIRKSGGSAGIHGEFGNQGNESWGDTQVQSYRERMGRLGKSKEYINSIAESYKVRYEKLTKSTDYQGEHQAPTADGGEPLHDMKNTYPSDIYSHQAAHLYGHGVPYDHESISVIQSNKGKPNNKIRIYRAVPHTKSNQEQVAEYESHKRHIQKYGKVPPKVNTQEGSSAYYNRISDEIERLKTAPETIQPPMAINRGDWVTTSRQYAKDHGESALNGQYKILSKLVPAKHVFTDGNSIHEWGYDPGETSKKTNYRNRLDKLKQDKMHKSAEDLQKGPGRIAPKALEPKMTRPDQESTLVPRHKQMILAYKSKKLYKDPARLSPIQYSGIALPSNDRSVHPQAFALNDNHPVIEHEGHHRLVDHLAQKFGVDKIHNLYNNIINQHIHPSVHKLIDHLLSESANYSAMKNHKLPRYRLAYLEEKVNMLRDLVHGHTKYDKEQGKNINMPSSRRLRLAHTAEDQPLMAHLGFKSYNDMDNKVKQSWQAVMNAANKTKPEDL